MFIQHLCVLSLSARRRREVCSSAAAQALETIEEEDAMFGYTPAFAARSMLCKLNSSVIMRKRHYQLLRSTFGLFERLLFDSGLKFGLSCCARGWSPNGVDHELNPRLVGGGRSAQAPAPGRRVERASERTRVDCNWWRSSVQKSKRCDNVLFCGASAAIVVLCSKLRALC